jgi:putative FmdB family regulatory protein
MPIYAYKCESCGHAKDVLQKVSDEPLTTCPACGASSFRKQITAAGFQLKGSGWYVTDFRGGSGGATGAAAPATAAAAASDGAKADGGSSASAGGDAGPAAPAGGCGASCACH